MTRQRIAGTLDLAALARLARPELEHRPHDPNALGREARALTAQGLSVRDVAAALRLAPAAIEHLLQPTPGHPPQENAP